MTEQFSLVGRPAHNIIGALGEIVAWDTLRHRGISAFKIGSWNFFPQGYPHFRDRRERLSFLTKKQADFVEHKEANQIIEFDFVGVKCKSAYTRTEGQAEAEYVYEGVEGVYLIEVKAGRGANIKHYIRNPIRAFSPENIRKAKAIGFKVALVVVELLEDWKYQVSYVEM